jgi:hypothetical protein
MWLVAEIPLAHSNFQGLLKNKKKKKQRNKLLGENFTKVSRIEID